MNCTNCGAPMTLIPSRDYFFCEYCSSFYFPEKDRDGLRVLGELTEVKCPICKEQLVTGTIEGNRLLFCSTCRGHLFNFFSFATVIRYLRTLEPSPETPPRPLNKEELEREIHCPLCGKQMDTHPYAGPGNVIIDNCPKCRVIWLDYGEFYRIVHAAGQDKGFWK